MKTPLFARGIVGVLSLLIVAVGIDASPRTLAATEQGRWKLGSQGCYWDDSDSGPDQCSPHAGRWKRDGLQCYWAPSDSGPNQCDPSAPPQFTEAQLDRFVTDANTLASMGAPIDQDLPTMQEMDYRVRSNIPFARIPAIALDYVWIVEEVWVNSYAVPVRGYDFPAQQTMPGYGLIPVMVRPPAPPRMMGCGEKAEKLQKMQQLALALVAGGSAYGGAAIEVRNFPRLAMHGARFARAGWFYGVLALITQSWVQLIRDAPCVPDQA